MNDNRDTLTELMWSARFCDTAGEMADEVLESDWLIAVRATARREALEQVNLDAALDSLLDEDVFPDFAYNPTKVSPEYLAEIREHNLGCVKRAWLRALADTPARGSAPAEEGQQ